ncbi:MAG: hypothetical protein J6C64_00655 [Lachnospiraceae bacterium]|nr:hypothetical protein [Lachnospiraceae bacterium]
MLDLNKNQQMTDIIHGTIHYSGIEHAVISTPIFNRLHRVLQSSLVFLTYPSNKVKRFEHSMGVMDIAGKIFFNSFCNASNDVTQSFMNDVSAELINWRNNINFEKYSFVKKGIRTQYKGKEIFNVHVPNNNFYNQYCPNNLDKDYKFQYYVVFQGVRLAGLLHDVGHLPYSHILEHALKKMYHAINEEENHTDIELEFLHIMNRFVEGEDEIHEEIGKLLVNNIRDSIVQDINISSKPEIYFFLATFDFAERIICSTPSDNTIYSDLHLITAGVLDADRLDYCTRDAYCSGTNKAIFLYNRLLTTYTLTQINESGINKYFFCPSVKSKNMIEELLRRRADIFSEINYHHRVHKHEILLEEVISSLGIEELKTQDTINDLEYSLPLNISSIWKLISKLDSKNDWPEYQIIQLDDSWLDTLLKCKFFEKYQDTYLSSEINGNDILWNRFDELISATKRYHSFFKLTTDFRKFDRLFFNDFKAIEGNFEIYSVFLSDKITKAKSYNDFFNDNLSFVFNYCFEKLFSSKQLKDNFMINFENNINKAVKESDLNIEDCLLRSCMFSFGYQTAKTPLYLLDREDTPVKIEQISTQLQTFQSERSISPIFHLYYLPHYDTRSNTFTGIDFENFMEVLSTTAVTTMLETAKLLKIL